MLKIDQEVNRFWLNEKGELHREDGPAIEGSNGYKSWYINGERHRLDGPAIEYGDGNKYWFLDGEEYTEEEYKKKVMEYVIHR